MSKYNIREIAELANVSIATVSRVINNSPSVKEEKRKKILKIINEKKYRPNQVARSLYTNSSKLIGYIVPNIINPFFSELGRYLEEAALKKGYHVILCNSNDSYEKEIEYMENLDSMNVDGIIIITSNTYLDENISIPMISIDREFDSEKEYGVVRSDHYESGVMGTKYLYTKGCKKIAYLGPIRENSTGKMRHQGYADTCNKYDLDKVSVECMFNFKDALKKTEILLNENRDIDGILCGNDIVAMGCYKILGKRKIKVPEDIKIIGYDNIIGSYMMTPGLTTISQPIEDISKASIEYIIDLIEEKTIEKKEIIFPVELIERETT